MYSLSWELQESNSQKEPGSIPANSAWVRVYLVEPNSIMSFLGQSSKPNLSSINLQNTGTLAVSFNNAYWKLFQIQLLIENSGK